jgi:GTP-binding protein
MLNALAGPGQRPALVSKMPGRTRRINLFRVADKRGDFMVVADLPGYGYAKISKEGQRGIEDFLNKYLAGRMELGLVVLLVDCRLEAQEADREVLNALKALGLPSLVVATKVDKLTQNERASGAPLEALRLGLGLSPEEAPLPFSSTDVGAMQDTTHQGGGGPGMSDVWALIKDAILSMEEEEEEEEEQGEGNVAAAEEGGYQEEDDEEGGRGGVMGFDAEGSSGEHRRDAAEEQLDYFLSEEEFDESDFEDAFGDFEQAGGGSDDGSRVTDDDLFAFSSEEEDDSSGDRPW